MQPISPAITLTTPTVHSAPWLMSHQHSGTSLSDSGKSDPKDTAVQMTQMSNHKASGSELHVGLDVFLKN